MIVPLFCLAPGAPPRDDLGDATEGHGEDEEGKRGEDEDEAGEVEEEEDDAAAGESASPNTSSSATSLGESTQLVLDDAATFGLVSDSAQSRFEQMQQIIDEGLTLPNQAAPSRERRYAHWPELEHARVCWLAITLKMWHKCGANLPVKAYGHRGPFEDPLWFKIILATRSVIVGSAPPIPPTASA